MATLDRSIPKTRFQKILARQSNVRTAEDQVAFWDAAAASSGRKRMSEGARRRAKDGNGHISTWMVPHLDALASSLWPDMLFNDDPLY